MALMHIKNRTVVLTSGTVVKFLIQKTHHMYGYRLDFSHILSRRM